MLRVDDVHPLESPPYPRTFRDAWWNYVGDTPWLVQDYHPEVTISSLLQACAETEQQFLSEVMRSFSTTALIALATKMDQVIDRLRSHHEGLLRYVRDLEELVTAIEGWRGRGLNNIAHMTDGE